MVHFHLGPLRDWGGQPLPTRFDPPDPQVFERWLKVVEQEPGALC